MIPCFFLWLRARLQVATCTCQTRAKSCHGLPFGAQRDFEWHSGSRSDASAQRQKHDSAVYVLRVREGGRNRLLQRRLCSTSQPPISPPRQYHCYSCCCCCCYYWCYSSPCTVLCKPEARNSMFLDSWTLMTYPKNHDTLNNHHRAP